MDVEKLKKLQEDISNYISNNDLEDLDKNIENVLFKFLKMLNYDTEELTNVVIRSKNTKAVEESLRFYDIGVMDNMLDNDFKMILRVLPFSVSLEGLDGLIKTIIKSDIRAKYIVLTDSFDYKVYENISDNYEINYNLLADFNILDLKEEGLKENKSLTQVIKNISNKGSFDLMGKEVKEDSSNEDSKKEDKDEPKIKDKKEVVENLDKKKLTVAGIIVLVLIIGLAVKTSNNRSNKTPNMQIENSVTEDKAILGGLDDFNSSSNTNTSKIDLKTKLSVNLTSDRVLKIDFTSNIEEGGKVKFVIRNGDKKEVVYKDVDKDGSISFEFKLPNDWTNNVDVKTYFRFDEDNQKQDILDKYGDKGQNIERPIDLPDYALDFFSFNNSIKEDMFNNIFNEEDVLDVLVVEDLDTNGYEIMKDEIGNFRVKPKGFDMEQVNITEDINLYPEILYDASNDKLSIQLVVGLEATSPMMFNRVILNSNGENWSYDIGMDEIYTKLKGIKTVNWVYLNSDTYGDITKVMKNIVNGKSPKLILDSGLIKKEVTITDYEKDLIANFLKMYEKEKVRPFL